MGTAAAGGSVNDDLIARLKTLLRLRMEAEEGDGLGEEAEEAAVSSVRKKEISEVCTRHTLAPFYPLGSFQM